MTNFTLTPIIPKEAKVKGFVYAALNSTYGDHPDLPKVEDKIGNPLSHYAVTKVVNELYASVFTTNYGFSRKSLFNESYCEPVAQG